MPAISFWDQPKELADTKIMIKVPGQVAKISVQT